MPDPSPVTADRQERLLGRGESRPVEPDEPEFPRAGTLVARGYGRRDYFLRRLLAISDVFCLALAMSLAVALHGPARSHSSEEYLLFGLVTLPAWVVLFKMYGLYERDTKRLSHSTIWTTISRVESPTNTVAIG